MRTIITLIFIGAFVPVAEGDVVGKEISYEIGDTTFNGYVATDTAIEGECPGVIVVHEWWGHNDYARERAKLLAELGYTAMALDMYGDGKVADHPDDAGKFAGEATSNMEVAEARFRAAMDVLKQQPNVDGERIAAIGYCFGGGVVLEMARRGVDPNAVASFHGALGTAQPAKPNAVKARVAAFNGADDPFVKPEQIEAFTAEMDNAKVDYIFVNYPGAVHSFTNPYATAIGEEFDLPLKYSAKADKDSWAKMQEMFDDVFTE